MRRLAERKLAKLKKGAPDVVLLDVLMPGGIDGLQTLEKMLKIYPQLKVIMLSCVSDLYRNRMSESAASTLQAMWTC